MRTGRTAAVTARRVALFFTDNRAYDHRRHDGDSRNYDDDFDGFHDLLPIEECRVQKNFFRPNKPRKNFDVFSAAAAGKCCLYRGDEEFEARFIFPPPFAPQQPMRRTKIDRKRFLKTERLKRRKNPSRTFAFSKSLRDKRPENRRSAYFPILSKTICQANPTKFSKAFSLRLSDAFFMRQRRPRFPFSSGHPISADVRSRIFESFSPFQESRKEEF